MKKENEEDEPLSPMARVFQSPDIDLCVVVDVGFKSKINTEVVLDALKHNVYKHPRFSSKLSEDGAKWMETEVNVEDHVTVPYIDPEEISEGGGGQSFVADYISNLTMIPLDRSRPLWDIHILNIKTSDAEAVVVIRFNHALGDGMSFFSLVLACTHQTSNPDMLSTSIPNVKRRSTVSYSRENTGWFLRAMFTIGSIVRLIWNTVVDMVLLFATLLFLKDTETPLKGGSNVRTNPKRFYHRNISLHDIKLIKNAMNMTINDVLLGITTAALSSYLNRQYDIYNNNEEEGALTSYPNNLPDGIRFRAGCTSNLRSDIGFKPLEEMMVKDSKCRWGNYFSFIILPISIGLETDPLVYLTKSKAMMARKKHSYHAALMYFVIKIFLKVLGPKTSSSLFNKYVRNITTCVTNVMGPTEEISLLGHPIAYISPSSYGHSHALFIQYTSYADEMTITITVDPTVIPDPHKICDDMEESLKKMKEALLERGLL